MLMELTHPLKAGDSVPVTLVFEDAKGVRSKVEVAAKVDAMTASGPPAH
jgi:copper(I)-binding protein